jgi:hypothetical protein
MQLSSGLPGVARNHSTFGLSDRLLGKPCHARAMYARRSDLPSDRITKSRGRPQCLTKAGQRLPKLSDKESPYESSSSAFTDMPRSWIRRIHVR